MDAIKQRKPITPNDIATFLGIEEEYRGLLLEEELKQTYENFKNGLEVDVNLSESEEPNEQPNQ